MKKVQFFNFFQINLFTSEENLVNDLEIARKIIIKIKSMFNELEELRAFELLRNHTERGNHLISRQAQIIAMTCTHAALKRRDFVDLGLEYDSILMEEAAQILEVETFIPLLLQNPCSGENRLKRVISCVF